MLLVGPSDVVLLILFEEVLIPTEAGADVDAEAILVPDDCYMPPFWLPETLQLLLSITEVRTLFKMTFFWELFPLFKKTGSSEPDCLGLNMGCGITFLSPLLAPIAIFRALPPDEFLP